MHCRHCNTSEDHLGRRTGTTEMRKDLDMTKEHDTMVFLRKKTETEELKTKLLQKQTVNTENPRKPIKRGAIYQSQDSAKERCSRLTG